MDNDHMPSGSKLVPGDKDRRLSLPSEMVDKGLELAARIERQQGIERYNRPILKFPGLLERSCIDFARSGEFAAITSHGRQADNPGLVIWKIGDRTLSVFPEAGFRNAAPSPSFVERIPTDEQMGVSRETSPISEIKISVTGARYEPIGHPDSTPRDIYSVALSKHGDMALIGYGDGSIYRCRIVDGSIHGFTMVAKASHNHEVGAIAFSPDDRLFAECTGYQVRIRDTASGEEIKQFKGYNSYYNQIVFSDDGNSLLVARGERKGNMTCMTLHNISASKPPVVFGGKRLASVTAVAMFPDGTRSVSLEQRGVIAVWDAGDGCEIKRWKHTESSSNVGNVVYMKQLPGNLVMEMANSIIWGLSSVAVSPDGKRILSGGGDRYMRLWTPAGEELWKYPHDSRVVRVAFSPDGSRALAGCWDGSVHLWKLPG